MKTLLEDYQRKLKTVNEYIAKEKNDGSIVDVLWIERLNTKASEYQSFIVDIERAIERSNQYDLEQIQQAFLNENIHYSIDFLKKLMKQ
jgi:hypothetical protein